MGFYGNITNTSNTTFSFDKIYSNRREMDANVNNDGIFIGRYVLVEYDKDAAYPVIYTNGTEFFSDNTLEKRINYSGEKQKPEHESTIEAFYKNDIGQVQIPSQQDEFGNELKYQVTFYRCIGGDENQNALFEEITTTSSNTLYTNNYAIDEKEYSDSYDSTVWVKASQTDEATGKRISKYVKIAELNSVVPTFNLIVDRPTSVPIAPHFDMDSTNVNYGMHIQPQWGFRIATADKDHSDQNTQWIKYEYNSVEDKEDVFYASGIKADGTPNWSKNEANLPAAIYYNKKAFEPKGINGVITRHDDKTEDSIHFSLGKSGNQYNIHNGKNKGYETSVQDDTQELTINLPSIGNMMSDAWDIIHGLDRDDYEGQWKNNDKTKDYSSLQGRLNSFSDLASNEIPLKRTSDGKIISSKINGVSEVSDDFKGDYDDAWIQTSVNAEKQEITIHHTYDLENKLNYKDIGHLEGKLNSNNDTTNNIDLNDGTNKFKINTPIVDSMGHVVGRNTETIELPYGYKYFKTDGIVSEDKKGDLYSTNVNTNGIQETKPAKVESDTEAHNTQDTLSINPANKWIQTKLVDTEKDGDVLTIAHEIHSIDERYDSNTNLNDLSIDNENEKGNLTIYDWSYDEAGHINKKREHTYTLPYGFKYIKTNGLAKENNLDIINKDLDKPTTETATANSTQDTFNIDTVNKWIQIEVTDSDNRIKIAHELHEITKNITTADTDDLNNQKNDQVQNTVNIPDWSFDNAGHITHKSDRIYTLPYGYKTFTVSNSDTVGPHSVGNGALAARNTRDNLTFVTENNWIALEAVADNEAGNKIYIGHKTNGNSFGKTYYAKGIEPPENDAYKQEPKFGETANILNVIVDNAGHVTGFGTNTIKIPTGSLDDKASNGADVITQLAFDEPTGHLTSTRTNVGTLKLTGYSNDTTNLEDKTLQITSDDSINSGLKTIQNYINALDETDSDQGVSKYVSSVTQKDGKITVTHAGTNTLQLSNYTYIGNGTKDTQTVANGQSINTALGTLEKRINDLDYADPDANTTQFVSKVTEEEGIISVERANVGGLVLTGYTTSGKGSGEVGETDTVNSAFAKIENKINTFLKDADISTNAIDTLKELQDYIDKHGKEAANIVKAIEEEANTARSEEGKLDSAIKAEALRADTEEKKIAAALTEEIDRASTAEQVNTTAIETEKTRAEEAEQQLQKQINAFGTAAKQDIEYFATSSQGATADTAAATIATYGDIVTHSHSEYALAGSYDDRVEQAVYDVKIAELEQENYTVNSRCNVLDKEVKGLINRTIDNEAIISTNTSSIDIVESKLLEEIAIREEQINTLNSRCNVLDYEVKQLINKVEELTKIINNK